MDNSNILEWQSYNREPVVRSEDWFWGLIAIAFFAAVISLIFGNILLAMIIGLAAFSLYHHERHPADTTVKVKIDKRGILLNKDLHTYEKVRSFWIEDATEDRPSILIIHYERIFVPNIHVPIIGIDPATVRKLLLKYGEEEKHIKTFTEVIYETFGF